MAPQAAVRSGDDHPANLDVAVVERRDTPGAWAVEAIDYDSEGDVYLAVFSGPQAQQRAREYAGMKYGVIA